MACGICKAEGHNKRTHADHQEPQDQALIEPAPGIADLLDRLQASVDRARVGRDRVVEPVRDHVALPIGTSSEVGKEEEGPMSAAPDRCPACDVVLTDGESFFCSDCTDAPPVVPGGPDAMVPHEC